MKRIRKNISTLRSHKLAAISLGSIAAVEGGLGGLATGQTPAFHPTATGSTDFAAADFDRDGFVVLAVTSPAGPITILFNDGRGGFTPRQLASGGGEFIIVGDFDGNRAADFITAGGAALRIRFGDGRGGFSAPIEFAASHAVYGIAGGDFNLDDRPDLVLSQGAGDTWRYEVMLNDGQGGFNSVANGAYQAYGVQPSRFSAVTGDFDGDGDVDAAMIHQDYGSGGNYDAMRLQIILNNGDGTQWNLRSQLFNQGDFYDPGSHLVTGDIDGDGDLDLMYNNGERDGTADLRVLANDGGGAFSAALTWTPSFNNAAQGGRLADFDGDGHLGAIAVVSGTGTRAFLLRGKGPQTLIMSAPDRSGASKVEVPDVSGDGARDLVALVSRPESGVLVLHNEIVVPRPRLTQTPLRRGQTTTFEVTGAEEGERIWFLQSLLGTEASVGVAALGGISIDLAQPVVMGSSLADGSGAARLTRLVPGRAPFGAILATQAVIRRGPGGKQSVKSNFITAPID
ncbi:MAG: VCBS repeat-containing protein [Phycisphaerales bacterium]|nr:VCBS repeat-containing protein [Phycisphaerales bacterium]